MITRRQFLSTVGIGLLGGFSPISFTLAGDDEIDISDFTIEKRVDAKCLIDIVDSNHEYYTPGFKEIEQKYAPICNSHYQNLQIKTFDKDLFPKFLISFPYNGQSQNQDEGSLGNITLLNDQGFFLTPHHCIEDYLNEPDTKRRWLIVFDPINETVYTSDILIHSERYDIAIGKLKTNKYNIFNKISNKNISLAKEQPKRGNLVFCLKYRDIDSVLKLIYNDVFNEGLLNWSEIDNGYMIDRFDGIDDFKINRLKPVTPVGFYEDDCSSPEGPLRSNWRCSRFIDIIRKGHSGSPIYNNRSQLLGIISYMTQLTPAINDCEGIRFDMAFFAGPKVISKMISFYNQKVK